VFLSPEIITPMTTPRLREAMERDIAATIRLYCANI